MVAVERHQDRGARGEADHVPFEIADHDMVIGAKGLPDRKHDARHVIVDRVADREADGEADHACAPKESPEQGGRLEQIEREDQPDDDEHDAHPGRDQFGKERVGCDRPPQAREPR